MSAAASVSQGRSSTLICSSHIVHWSLVSKATSWAVLFEGKLQAGQCVQSSVTIRMPVTMQNGDMFLHVGQSSCSSAKFVSQYMQGDCESPPPSASAQGLRTMFSIFFLYCSETCGLYSGRMSIQAY